MIISERPHTKTSMLVVMSLGLTSLPTRLPIKPGTALSTLYSVLLKNLRSTTAPYPGALSQTPKLHESDSMKKMQLGKALVMK